ncbi:MAG: hypothetical protein GF398_13760 [Chitinivibrionales bacterium]|nr:hypothetical protein [Chitinivibrionales bacterium]
MLRRGVALAGRRPTCAAITFVVSSGDNFFLNLRQIFSIGSQTRLSYVYLFKWVVLALLAGSTGALVVRVFSLLLDSISTAILHWGVPLPLIPICGALVAGGIIYRLQPHAAGEGIPSYIRGIRVHKGDLLFSVTFYKFWAALATLATFGNGGIVGPLGRTSAGSMALITRGLRRITSVFDEEDQKTSAICGLAAAVGTIFHTPIGGGIFAVEIIQKARMGYKDLFPAILSSATATIICKLFGWDSFYPTHAGSDFMDHGMIGWLLLLALVAGLVGGAYPTLYSWITRIIKRKEGNVLLKVTLGSGVAGIIGWLVHPQLMGTSSSLIDALVQGDLHLIVGNLGMIQSLGIVLLIALVVKAVCNCITVGSGMSAGFAGPAAITGMLLGATAACFLNVEIGSPTYAAFIAGGFASMLASTMNIPLASAVMAVEIFGLQCSFPAGLSAIVGFQVTRHGTIYDYALAGAGVAIDE